MTDAGGGEGRTSSFGKFTSPLRTVSITWWVAAGSLYFAFTALEEAVSPDPRLCIQRHGVGECAARLQLEQFREALSPVKLVGLDEAEIELRRWPVVDYTALSEAEWTLLRFDEDRAALVRLLGVHEETAWVYTREGMLGVAGDSITGIHPLGRSGDERLFGQGWGYDIVGFIIMLIALLFGGPPQGLRMGMFRDRLARAQEDLRLLSPIRGHRWRSLLLAGAHASTSLALLSLGVALVHVLTSQRPDWHSLVPSLSLFTLAWFLIAAREVIEILSGIDFDIPKKLRNLWDTATPMPFDGEVERLELSDIHLLRNIDRMGTVGALLHGGVRTSTPLLEGIGEEDAEQRDLNNRLFASVTLLRSAGFLRPVGRDHELTEMGRRALHLPDFYTRPQIPAELVVWVARAEQHLRTDGRAGDAMQILLPQLELWLQRVVARLVLEATDPARAMVLLHRARKQRRPARPKLDRSDAWRAWLERRLQALGVKDVTGPALIEALDSRFFWEVRLVEPAREAEQVARQRRIEPLAPERFAQLFGPEGPHAHGWPRGATHEDVVRAIRATRQDTLRPLFSLTRELLDNQAGEDSEMWRWADRIGEHRNKLFHGREPYQPKDDGSDVVAAHEIIWLARPLLFRLNQALQRHRKAHEQRNADKQQAASGPPDGEA